MRRLAIISLTLLVCAAASADADYSKGGAFRHPGYGARAWGMGGAAVATVDDESAVSWNPAMLSLLGSNQAGASYVNLVSGVTARQSQVVYAHVLERGAPDDEGQTSARHVVGVMYTNLHLEIAGGESYNENLMRVAYALSPDYFVSFAIAGDFLLSGSDVQGFDAVGSSVDFAARLMLTENVTVGAVARHAFSRYSYDDGLDYSLDRAFVLGASYSSIPYATLEADIVYDHGDVARTIGGLETDYLFDVIALRGGIASVDSGESRTVPHFGFGLRAPGGRFIVHYNANLDDEKAFEDTHRFSLSVSI
jgi:hypothetical protein